jgi:hypothetical protein
MATFTERMLGAAKLEVATFEEVENDSSATPQALIVVALAALAVGIGSLYFGGAWLLVKGVIGSIIGWAIWAALIWVIGTKLLPESTTNADWGQVARTTGFAQSPGLLRVFGFIPVLGPIVLLVSNLWMLVAMVIAVRQALDYTQTWRAIAVVLIGWFVNLLLLYLLAW